jgi:hypothetical protein
MMDRPAVSGHSVGGEGLNSKRVQISTIAL